MKYNFYQGVVSKNTKGSKINSSKKRHSGENDLTEILVHVMKNAFIQLKKSDKFTIKYDVNVLNFYSSRRKDMKLELLQKISELLSTYKIDDPIMEPTLGLFEYLDLRNMDSPDQNTMDNIWEAVKSIYEREFLNQDSILRKPIYVAISKLVQISTLHDTIGQMIESILDKSTSFLSKLEQEDEDLPENIDQAMYKILELCSNFNLMTYNKSKALKFYQHVINALSNIQVSIGPNSKINSIDDPSNKFKSLISFN